MDTAVELLDNFTTYDELVYNHFVMDTVVDTVVDTERHCMHFGGQNGVSLASSSRVHEVCPV